MRYFDNFYKKEIVSSFVQGNRGGILTCKNFSFVQ